MAVGFFPTFGINTYFSVCFKYLELKPDFSRVGSGMSERKCPLVTS